MLKYISIVAPARSRLAFLRPREAGATMCLDGFLTPVPFFSPRRMFEKVVIVDGRGHLQGRLASIVAKELLNGWVETSSPRARPRR
jgi:hypothetical protein